MSFIAGGCLCAAIRFAIAGQLGAAAYCHCADCRKCTGSAFNVSVGVARADFAVTQGRPSGFTKRAESGNELTRHFCAGCGSPLFTSSARHPDIYDVKAGALDDPALIAPQYQSWTQSAVSWATIEAGLPFFSQGRG